MAVYFGQKYRKETERTPVNKFLDVYLGVNYLRETKKFLVKKISCVS